MRALLRFLFKTVLFLGVLLALLLAIVALRLGPIVKTAVNRAAPALMGVPVSVGDVSVALRRGEITLDNLVVGNPPGFDTPFLFKLDKLHVDVELASLLSHRVHVRSVVVEAPQVWYERTLAGSNLKAFQAQQAATADDDAAQQAEASPETAGKSPARTVLIDLVQVKQGRVGLKMGVGGEIPLPSVELRDIGKDEPDGVTWGEALQRIVTAVLSTVTDAVKSVADLSGKGLKTLGKGTLQGGKLLGDGAGDAAKGVGEIGKDIGKTLKNRFKGLGDGE